MKYEFAIYAPATIYVRTWVKADSKKEALKLAEGLRSQRWKWELANPDEDVFEISSKAQLEVEELEEIPEDEDESSSN